jgi:hypothetical protein
MLDSDLRCEADENFALLGHYATSSGSFLPTFRDNVSVAPSGFKNTRSLKVVSSGFKNPRFLNPEEGTDRLSRNAGKKLSLLAA